MTTFATSVRLGTSYITLSSTSSKIALRPRAPVPRKRARSAISSNASGANSSSTLSSSKSLWYCLINAFFGSTRTAISASRSSLLTDVNTGSRPMNSGIMPNLIKSSGITCANTSAEMSLLSSRSPSTRSKVKPRLFLPNRASTSLSKPANAPPTMNNTLVVSMEINS